MKGRNATACMVLVNLAIMCAVAFPRDSGQWEREEPDVRHWYRTLMQPDNPSMSCCGEADAYWADEVETKGDKVIAIITDTRPDGPLGRRPIPPGTKFEIPQNKITYRGGNPTGHIVIFVNQLDAVLCYVMNGGV
jgi:hypothetical protein